MRKKLFKWHSYMALIAILPLFIISITGSILVYKVEIDTWLNPHYMMVEKTEPLQRVPLDDLIKNLKAEHPNYEVGSWEMFDTTRADTAYIIKRHTNEWYKIYINQYTGTLLSPVLDFKEGLTDWLLDLHFRLLLDEVGLFLGAIISIFFVFLSLSGIILYRQFWKKFFTLRFKQANRIFFSDVHKMIGIASSPVFLALGITGAYWNISETIHEVSEHVFEEPYLISAPLHNTALSIEELYQKSKQDIAGFKPNYLVLPFDLEHHFEFFGEVDTANSLNSEYASKLTYHKQTGERIERIDIREASVGHAIIDSFRKLHFGYFAGNISKFIWCVLGLSPVWLSITGLYLYMQRRKRYVKW